MLFWFDSWKAESYFFSRVADWPWRFENTHIQPICTKGSMWYPGLYCSSVSLLGFQWNDLLVINLWSSTQPFGRKWKETHTCMWMFINNMCFKICSSSRLKPESCSYPDISSRQLTPWTTTQLYEIMAGYKPVAIQTYPVLGEKITQDTLYWSNYRVKYERKWGRREFGHFFICLCLFLQLMLAELLTKLIV